MSKQMVPEVRFDGFEGEWEVSKIKDIANISTGNSNTQDNVKYGQYPFYVRSKTIERSDQHLFDEEAVLTVGDGVGTGKVFHYVNGKYDLHQRVYRVFNFNEKINAKYFYFYFSKFFYNRVMSLTAKTSVDSVRYEMISEMGIKYPVLYEQKKISDFLTKLEDKISNSEQNIIKLKQFKQAMLQKMFPKEGEKEPEVRFEGFSEEWKIDKLGNALKYEQPTKYIVESDDYKDNQYTPVLTAGKSLLLGYTDETSGVYDANKENSVIIFDDFTTSSHYIDYNFKVKSSAMKLLTVSSNRYNLYFMHELMNNINYIPGNHERHWISIFSKFDVLIPSKAEQIKIGNFFKSLDDKIALEEQNLEKLQQFKKAMLQKMFV